MKYMTFIICLNITLGCALPCYAQETHENSEIYAVISYPAMNRGKVSIIEWSEESPLKERNVNLVIENSDDGKKELIKKLKVCNAQCISGRLEFYLKKDKSIPSKIGYEAEYFSNVTGWHMCLVPMDSMNRYLSVAVDDRRKKQFFIATVPPNKKSDVEGWVLLPKVPTLQVTDSKSGEQFQFRVGAVLKIAPQSFKKWRGAYGSSSGDDGQRVHQ